MKIAMLVTGFPTADAPERGIFNRRAAEDLNRYVDLTVLHIRLYKPGRKLVQTIDTYPWHHLEIAMPLLPILHKKPIQEWMTLADWWIGIVGGRYLFGSLLRSFDVFHSVGAAFSGPVCSAWVKRTGQRHVMQIVGSDVNFELPALIRLPGGRKWMRWVHGVAANSRNLAERYIALNPIATRVRTLYRGTDLEMFRPGDHPAGTEPVFLYLGGLPRYSPAMFGQNQKGGITLMQAWSTLDQQNEGPPGQLVFAGPGADCQDTQEWRTHLRYPDRVHVADAVRPEDVVRRMQAAGAIIIPSMAEGLPNIGMEALACGKCLIGSRTGGIPELIQSGVNGWVFEPGDGYGLAMAIQQAAADRDRLIAFGDASRRIAMERFDHTQYAPALINLYREVLER
ncbi:glycosyltransferase family 4 protein [bacterium]|nr:glycosyltransferase family 4 protein [candidate division CSSED10-310 bacterium]